MSESFGGPDERFRILVVLVDVVADGHDELFEVFEDAAVVFMGDSITANWGQPWVGPSFLSIPPGSTQA